MTISLPDFEFAAFYGNIRLSRLLLNFLVVTKKKSNLVQIGKIP